jgi:protein-tyrosine phosphatase
MIDLHSHILPGVDDGSSSLEQSLEMGRMAANDGIEVMACTPHFMPGLYNNEAYDIRSRTAALNSAFLDADIDVALVTGCDAHMRPDFVDCLNAGTVLTIHDTRYVLFEPPHTVMPQRMNDLLFDIQAAGYVPILTHPERLQWIEQGYRDVVDMANAGVWIQITAGSLTGRFGRNAAYWAKRMLAEGLVSILATDCHNLNSRPPRLANARDIAQSELGSVEADNLVWLRPSLILDNSDPASVPPRLAKPAAEKISLVRRMLKW